jgi:hypothetical protein
VGSETMEREALWGSWGATVPFLLDSSSSSLDGFCRSQLVYRSRPFPFPSSLLVVGVWLVFDLPLNGAR